MQTLYFIQQNLNTGEFSLIHHSVFYEQHKIKEFSTSNMGFMEGLCQFMQEYYPKFPPAEIIQALDIEQLIMLYPEEAWANDIFLRFIKDLDDDGYMTYDIFDYNSLCIHIFFCDAKWQFVFEEGVNESYVGNGYYEMLSTIGDSSNSLIHKLMIDPSKISNNPLSVIV